MIDRSLLIIEDDPGLQSQMRWCFENVEIHVAGSGDEARAVLRDRSVDVVTLDLGLPPDPGGVTEGFAMLRQLVAEHPHTKVIVITGREEQTHAVEAIANGAYDYYQKPIDATTLKFAVDRAMNLANLEAQHRDLKENSDNKNMPLKGLIASCSEMVNLARQVERVAPSDVNVLITGETGTGKEIIANNLHALSNRADAPLITINCAAIPEALLESELFGHEKGSFTGAHARKIGKVEAANGGTLFLDEIGDMPLALQAKILRFLQERKFERVGSTTSIDADVRVVSATHRNLQEMIGAGTFREDLFYRISEIELALPALRDRDGDVILIAEKLLRENQGDRNLRFDMSAITAMEKSPWPGNIRELENKVRRAAILAESEAITSSDLQLDNVVQEVSAADIRPLKDIRAVAEQKAVARTLAVTKGNISETSRLLGVSRPTLYNLIEKYNLAADQSK